MKASPWWLVLVATACRTDSQPMLEPLVAANPAAPFHLVREAHDAAQGGYDLFRPSSPIVVNGSIWLLEMGNDQLVRFDSTLSSASAFAHEGEGPGEIQYAMDMERVADRLLVAEIGNGRVSTFDTTGAFRGTLRLTDGPQFIADLAGHLVTTLQSSPAYAYRVDDRGGLQPFAEIPDAVNAIAHADPGRYPAAGPYIAGMPNGDLVVLDQSTLVLSRYDQNGRLLRSGPIPEPFRTNLLDQRLKVARAFGKVAESFLDTPAAKRLSVDRDGRLLVLFSLPDVWGMLIDVDRWTAHAMPLPKNQRLHDILWAACDAALDGDRIWLISDNQLYELAADGER